LIISIPFSWLKVFHLDTADFITKVSISFAINPFHGRSPRMDSAPIDVVTLGVPHSIASSSFPLIPAPNRRGAKTTRFFPTTSFALGARPFTINPP
jgi:hypothetical protein